MRSVLENWKSGVAMGGAKISNLRFADDTLLLARSEGELMTLTKRLEQANLVWSRNQHPKDENHDCRPRER